MYIVYIKYIVYTVYIAYIAYGYIGYIYQFTVIEEQEPLAVSCKSVDEWVLGAGKHSHVSIAFHVSWSCVDTAQSALVERSTASISSAVTEGSITLAISAHFKLLLSPVTSLGWLCCLSLSLCRDLHFQSIFSNDSRGCFREDLVS